MQTARNNNQENMDNINKTTYMKKVFLFAFCLLTLASCGDGKSSGSSEDSQKDSLQRVIEQRDNEINDMMGILNEVEEGFRLINEAENRVSVARNGEGASRQQQIRENIQFIQQRMAENRELIAKLRSQVKNGTIKSEQLQKTIDNLTKQLEDKDNQIKDLYAQLEAKDIHIEELQNTTNTLSKNVDILQDDNANFAKYWPADLHMVGKEITRFHTIIWPALLMALDLHMPKQVYGHGWLNFYGDKMSKSKGNVAYPLPLIDRYGADAVRYYLLREIPFGSDGSYTDDSFLGRINTDLCNTLGNLVSRTTAMITQYFGGKVPEPQQYTDLDNQLIDTINGAKQAISQHIDMLNVPEALADIWKILNRANKYIDETCPWTLAKDQAQKGRLQTVLYCLEESIRVSAILLAPFLPHTAQKIYDKLTLGKLPKNFKDAVFGRGKAGKTVVKGDNLFDRLDINKELKIMQDMRPKATEKTEDKAQQSADKATDNGEITIEDFAKVQLVTAKVLSCEKVEKSDKLLKSTVKIGNETRTVVSGIAKYYSPEEMVGKKVVMITNLKPAKLRGIVSEGMILCAEDAEGNLKLIAPEADIADGSGIF